MDISLTYVLPKNRPISAQHVDNGQFRIRLKREDPRVLFEPFFLHISAVYGRIFLKPTAYFFLNYRSTSIFIVLFILPTK